MRRKIFMVVTLFASSFAARASTIDFDGLPADETLFSTYSEAGFTVTAADGAFYEGTSQGNTTAQIIARDDGTVTITNGGLFTFSSLVIDVPQYATTGELFIGGFRSGEQVYSERFYGTVPPFPYLISNFGFDADPIDLLEVQAAGNVAVDNIVVNAVPPMPTSVTPEPSSIALLATGLVGVTGVIRHRSYQV